MAPPLPPPPPPRRPLLFIALYLAFLVVLVEGAARLAFGVPAISDRVSVPDDYGWRRMWVKRHKSKGEQIYFNFDTFDVTKGWRSRANIRDMAVFDKKVLNTNANGFRGARDFSPAKDSGRVRIVVIGDSFTFGESMSDDETFPAEIQRALPGAEVMNLGVHGYGHDQMLIHLRESGLPMHPDIVVLGYIAADQSRNLLGFRDYAKPRFEVEGDSLELEGSPVPTPEATIAYDWARPRVVDLASTIRHMMRGVDGRRAMGERVTQAILRQMALDIAKAGAVPVFAYLPAGKEVSGAAGPREDEQWFARTCKALAKVRCMSARPLFDARVAAGETFKQKGHWDAAGQKVVGEAISRFLIDSLGVKP